MATVSIGTFSANVDVATQGLKAFEQEAARYAKQVADNNVKEALAAENNVRAAFQQPAVKDLKYKVELITEGGEVIGTQLKAQNSLIEKINKAKKDSEPLEEGSLSRLRGQLRTLSQQRDAIPKINAETGKVTERWKDANRQVQEVNLKIAQVDGNLLKIAKIKLPLLGDFLSFGNALTQISSIGKTVVEVFQAIAAALKPIVQRQKQLEGLRLSFEGFGASAGDAAELVEAAKRVSLTFGASLTNIEKAFKRLTPAILQSGGSMQETEEIIAAISARTVTLGLNTEQSGRYVEAFAQVMGKGKLQGEELNQQFSELDGALRGQIKSYLQTTKGITDFEKAMQNGEITSELFREAFLAVSRTMVDNLGGSLDNVQQKLREFRTEGKGTIQQMENLGATLNSLTLESFGETFAGIGKFFADIQVTTSQFFASIANDLPGLQELLSRLANVVGFVLANAWKGLLVIVKLVLKAFDIVIEAIFGVLDAIDGFISKIPGATKVLAFFAAKFPVIAVASKSVNEELNKGVPIVDDFANSVLNLGDKTPKAAGAFEDAGTKAKRLGVELANGKITLEEFTSEIQKVNSKTDSAALGANEYRQRTKELSAELIFGGISANEYANQMAFLAQRQAGTTANSDALRAKVSELANQFSNGEIEASEFGTSLAQVSAAATSAAEYGFRILGEESKNLAKQFNDGKITAPQYAAEMEVLADKANKSGLASDEFAQKTKALSDEFLKGKITSQEYSNRLALLSETGDSTIPVLVGLEGEILRLTQEFNKGKISGDELAGAIKKAKDEAATEGGDGGIKNIKTALDAAKEAADKLKEARDQEIAKLKEIAKQVEENAKREIDLIKDRVRELKDRIREEKDEYNTVKADIKDRYRREIDDIKEVRDLVKQRYQDEIDALDEMGPYEAEQYQRRKDALKLKIESGRLTRDELLDAQVQLEQMERREKKEEIRRKQLDYVEKKNQEILDKEKERNGLLDNAKSLYEGRINSLESEVKVQEAGIRTINEEVESAKDKLIEYEQVTSGVASTLEGARQAFDSQVTAVDAASNAYETAKNRVGELESGLSTTKDAAKELGNELQRIDSITRGAAAENRFTGGPVSAGKKYTVNEFGQESFLSSSGKLSLIKAKSWGQWTPPSSGTVIPAHITSRLDIPTNGVNLNAPAMARNPITTTSSSSAVYGSRDNVTNNITIQSQSPVQDASRLMVNVIKQRNRRRF